jgi:hypothetical protein
LKLPAGLELYHTKAWTGKIPDEAESLDVKMDEGPAGIFEVTLPLAAALARKYAGDPRIVHLARTIAHTCPDEARDCVAIKIHNYVSGRVRYQDDPEGITFSKEFFYTPLKALRIIAGGGHFRGDCEEIACLTGTMLSAGGVPSGFVVGQRTVNDGLLFHVWILAQSDYAGDRWLHLDPTHHVPPGRTSGRFERYWFLPI